MKSTEHAAWERRFARFLNEQSVGDLAHDQEHIRRVVANARVLAAQEEADLDVVLPAAWLHDCVILPKNSPMRRGASAMAAEAAVKFLRHAGYPERHLDAIAHAIAAHSFSAGITPETAEARVVQDADRLDALGAIGLARCLTLGGAMGRRLYDPDEPFPDGRTPDDADNSLDHLFTKLLGLSATMTTAAGRIEAEHRTVFLRTFIDQLRAELNGFGRR